MKVSLEQQGADLCFFLKPEEDDIEHLDRTRIGLAKNEARINTTNEINLLTAWY